MKKEPILFMSALGLAGYGVFHGHRQGADCWLCKYRGVMFLGSSVALGVWLSFQESD